MLLLFVVLLLLCTLKSVQSSASCTTLFSESSSEAYALSLTCYGAVDYSFYLPSGVTLAYLNSQAESTLSNTKLSILPTSCQTALKKAVCASVYLKCVPGISLTDYSTWNYGIFKNLTANVSLSIPVPFERPCVSVCSNANGYCDGVLNIFNSELNCFSKTDYSFGAVTSLPAYPYTYDQSASSTSCNAMTASFQVASTKETYLFADTGACAGITTELFVPPGPSASSALAPMQSPYVVQSAIESSLAASFDQLPLWLSDGCYQALRKYFCGSYFLEPSAQTIETVLVENGFSVPLATYVLQTYGVNTTAFMPYTFYLPSYPNRSVCIDYTNQCGQFIAEAGKPSLVADCDKYANGTYSFPTKDQVISSLALTTSAIVKFKTSPNMMANTTSNGFETQCPYGFTVPSDPTNPHLVWVTGSGCTFYCRLSVWTNTDYARFDKLVRVLPGLGLPFLTLIIVTFLLSETRRRKQYMICYAAFCAWVLCIAFLSMSSSTYNETDNVVSYPQRFCESESAHITPGRGDHKCINQAAVLVFFAMSLCIAYGRISFDVYGGLVMNWVHKSWYRVAFDWIVLIVGPALCTSAALKGHYLGYDRQAPYCLFRYDLDPGTADFGAFYIPILIIFLICMILILRTLIRVVGMGLQVLSYGTNMVAVEGAGQDPELAMFMQQWRFHWKSLLFVMMETVMWFYIFAARYVGNRESDYITQEVKKWVVCIFVNWDGTDTPSWREVCGFYPPFRGHYRGQQWGYFCLIGHCVVVPFFFLPSVYKSIMACATGKSSSSNNEKGTMATSNGGGGNGMFTV